LRRASGEYGNGAYPKQRLRIRRDASTFLAANGKENKEEERAMTNNCPIVLVHGLFGYGPDEMLGFSYWGQAKNVHCPLPLFEASVGPISSSHDRACELFAQIRGGQVDYGKEHSEQAGHTQTGRTYTNGFYRDWSEKNPIHLVGHSLGGPTIRMFQYLLSQDFWGKGTNERWIKSITGISPVFNGATLCYWLGCSETDGLVKERKGQFLGNLLKALVAIMGPTFSRVYDFDLKHWEDLGPRRREESIPAFLKRVEISRLFDGTDNAAYGLSLQCLLEQNRMIATFPDTYYFSYVTEQTVIIPGFGYHVPVPIKMNWFLAQGSWYMGKKTFTKPFYPGFKNADWWENDGAVSSYSQMFPRISGDHPVAGAFSDSTDSLEPGRWYWQYLHGFDHLDIVMMPEPWQITKQRAFYSDLFFRLSALK